MKGNTYTHTPVAIFVWLINMLITNLTPKLQYYGHSKQQQYHRHHQQKRAAKQNKKKTHKQNIRNIKNKRKKKYRKLTSIHIKQHTFTHTTIPFPKQNTHTHRGRSAQEMKKTIEQSLTHRKYSIEYCVMNRQTNTTSDSFSFGEQKTTDKKN